MAKAPGFEFLEARFLTRLPFGLVDPAVLVEVVSHAFAVLEQQPPVHDLESVHINLDQFALREAVGAVTAERGFILCGILGEQIAVT